MASRLALPLLLCGACGGAAPEPDLLRLVSFDLQGEERAFLNQTLGFEFSGEVDPASLTSRSLRIEDLQGRAARGTLSLRGRRISFEPDLPQSPELQDGGLRPNTAYLVEIVGFPRPDGLRRPDQAPLDRCWRFSFRTRDPAAGPIFQDRTRYGLSPLTLVENQVPRTAPIRVRSERPLDPRTLVADDFELRHWRETAQGSAQLVRIPLRARLSLNRADLAEIELQPLSGEEGGPLRFLEPGEYHLWIDPDRCGLRDLGGRRVLPALAPAGWAAEIHVVAESEDQAGGWHHEAFLAPGDGVGYRSPAQVEGADGTAAWDYSGRVTVCYPAAAGDGSDGLVVLGEREVRRDLHATELHVPGDRTAWLSSQRGLVVLRSQGKLVVDGGLRRRLASPTDVRSSEGGWEWVERLLEEGSALLLARDVWHRGHLPAMEFEAGETLSAWLERQRARDPSWTVLVAGGDLVLRGTIELETPLLLVAGGAIRGDWNAVRPRLGSHFLEGANESRDRGRPPLVLDPPGKNPLVASLKWAVRSAPIPRSRNVAHWRSARVGGHAGSGSYSVRYIGERDVGGGVEEVGPVGDPALLPDECSALKLEVELEVMPGGSWDPPAVDFIELFWERASGEAP